MGRMTLSEKPVIPEQYAEAIYQALERIYGRAMWNMQQQFGMYDLPPLHGEALLLTPVAETLAEIACAAAGERQHDEFDDGVLQECIQSVMEMLFASPLLNTYDVPDVFWQSPLGAMVARAMIWLRRDELITLNQAAEIAGISVPAISQAVDAGRLRAYFDPDATNPQRGRRLVSRAEVQEVWNK